MSKWMGNMNFTELQIEALEKWDGVDCLTLSPNGSVIRESFKHVVGEAQSATEYDAAMTYLDKLGVPKKDERLQIYSLVGRIAWLKENEDD